MDIKFDQQEYDVSFTVSGDGLADLDITTTTELDLTQRLFLRFKTYPRDLFWNIGYGIDYLNKVFGLGRPKSVVDIIIKDEIRKEPLVRDIVSFESEVVNSKYACKFTVTAINEPRTITYYILTNESGIILTDSNGDVLTAKI